MNEIKKDKDAVIAAYTVDARSVVKISFISSLSHFKLNFIKAYSPEFTHQIFGKKEKIFGYLNPEIRIVYNETSGHCYASFGYEGNINSLGLGFVADDIWSKLPLGLPGDYFRDYNAYVENQKLVRYCLTDFGKAKYSFVCQTDDVRCCVFKAQLCSITEYGFKNIHYRFQTLNLWYINGASAINLDDPRWDVIYLYTFPCTRKGPPAVAGFCTIYKFYCHPDKIRARISQFIIFPQYQRCGVGIKFLHCVYNIIRNTIPNLMEITVEDPNEKFRMIRAINNATTVFLTPQVMAKFNLLDAENIDFIEDVLVLFKFSENETRFIADLITYACASPITRSNVRERVISRLRERFKKQYIRTVKCYRHSLHYNRGDITSDNIRMKFCGYRDEFLRMVSAMERHMGIHMGVTKIA